MNSNLFKISKIQMSNICSNRLYSLKNDYFIYDEKKFALTGVDTNIQYQLGQNVKIQVKSADLEKRQLNFLIV